MELSMRYACRTICSPTVYLVCGARPVLPLYTLGVRCARGWPANNYGCPLVFRYREAVQKVIHYMTLGIDVSRLFTEMIMVGALSGCYCSCLFLGWAKNAVLFLISQQRAVKLRYCSHSFRCSGLPATADNPSWLPGTCVTTN